MQIKYDKDADALYIYIQGKDEDLHMDYDSSGNLKGIEVLNIAHHMTVQSEIFEASRSINFKRKSKKGAA